MPGRGGILVYVNKVCDASYLEEFQSDQFESIWLKLHHPDPVIVEPTSEDAETSRPITIGWYITTNHLPAIVLNQ